MALIEWQDSFSVGVKTLDDHHKRLIAIINRIDEAEKSGKSVQWALEELRDYAEYHFRAEEERLEASDDYTGADLEEHKESHRAFVEWLTTVERTYNLSPEAHPHIAETVNEYLRDWLTHHILETDMGYKGKIS